ncbi:MAG: RnfABCDGE type electron transport complex subunit D, partial [Gammaproteobacteria bacterium]
MSNRKFSALFDKGQKWERFRPLYEAVDSFLFTPGLVTQSAPHVRDCMDFKRMMIIVVVALIPPTLMAIYNTGLQANLALHVHASLQMTGWRGDLLHLIGVGHDPNSILDNVLLGSLYFLPLYIVSMAVGGLWEVLFACVRRHSISESFLVTGLLFPLILPADTPLWQAALGISFGIVIG